MRNRIGFFLTSLIAISLYQHSHAGTSCLDYVQTNAHITISTTTNSNCANGQGCISGSCCYKYHITWNVYCTYSPPGDTACGYCVIAKYETWDPVQNKWVLYTNHTSRAQTISCHASDTGQSDDWFGCEPAQSCVCSRGTVMFYDVPCSSVNDNTAPAVTEYWDYQAGC